MPKTYSRAHVILHWVTLLLILQQFVLHDAISEAFRAVLLGQDIAPSPAVAAHVFGGFLVFVFALTRITMRHNHGVPAEAAASAAQKLAARAVHLGLYAVMIAMPVSGAVAWFQGVEAASQAHEVMKVLLLVLVALHVAGSLWHQFAMKDGLMRRMSLRG
jgi:cytochrome b561